MKRDQFASDELVQQIIEGRKTASVANVGEIEFPENEYNSALVVGEYYQVYGTALKHRCTIRITAMELCRWDKIPERLWRGETNEDAAGFKKDHLEWFNHPADDFEFIAYYFELISVE